MFGLNGSKFVEVSGVKLICRYWHHKFPAPQGIVAHKYIYERAGDTAHCTPQSAERTQVCARKSRKHLYFKYMHHLMNPDQHHCPNMKKTKLRLLFQRNTVPMPKHSQRSQIAEKLRIFDKHHELDNITVPPAGYRQNLCVPHSPANHCRKWFPVKK